MFFSARQFIYILLFLSASAFGRADHALSIPSASSLANTADVFDSILGHSRSPVARLSVLNAVGTKPATCFSTRDPKLPVGGGVLFYSDEGMRKVAVVADRPKQPDFYESHADDLASVWRSRREGAVPLTQAPLSIMAGMFDKLGQADNKADLREVAPGTYIVKVPEHGSDSWYCRFQIN